jgi:hypothetical protein
MRKAARRRAGSYNFLSRPPSHFCLMFES